MEVKDLERGPWYLGLCFPTLSGLVSCKATPEVVLALPPDRLPNQCQLGCECSVSSSIQL